MSTPFLKLYAVKKSRSEVKIIASVNDETTTFTNTPKMVPRSTKGIITMTIP